MQSLSTTPRPLSTPRIPDHRFPEDFNVRLLTIALGELPRPLRRSERARRDYVPEPVVYVVPKRGWLKGLPRLVRPVLVLIGVALILAGAKVSHDWFDTNYAYGALKPAPYHASSALRDLSSDPSIARIQRQEFDLLPSLPASWGWAVLPQPWATDAHAQPSYWVAARRKGTLPDRRYLPASGAHLGDHYVMDDDSNTAWIWMVPFGAKSASWIDP